MRKFGRAAAYRHEWWGQGVARVSTRPPRQLPAGTEGEQLPLWHETWMNDSTDAPHLPIALAEERSLKTTGTEWLSANALAARERAPAM